MVKYFCDCCGKELSTSLNKFSYLCHIADMCDKGYCDYVDSDDNGVSGRSEIFDLCNGCYNRVMVEAYKKFKELKGEV